MKHWDTYNIQDSIAEVDASTNLALYMRNAYSEKIEAILNSCFDAGDFVLDIGCGIGKWVTYLLGKDINCIGIDSSEIAIEKAKTHLEKISRADAVKMGDAARLEFKGKSFDGIISFGLLEHFPDHEKILNDWVSLLKDGGRIVLSVPNALRLDWLIWNALWVHMIRRRRAVTLAPRLRGFVTTFHGYEERWTPRYFTKLCRRSGLRSIETKTLFTLPAPLFYHLSNRLPSKVFRLLTSENESKRWGLYIVVVARK
ncbi:MAG: methyltransferase domain-containing protein [Gemmatimonadota bacterium]|nr:MAG: methyltransferase domain-containing protein [Gemmatimonadota bacterium]